MRFSDPKRSLLATLAIVSSSVCAAPLVAGCSASPDGESSPPKTGSTPAADQTLSCPETLDTFCAFPVAAANECAYRDDYAGALAVACNRTSIVALSYYLGSCGAYDVIGTGLFGATETLYFDSSTHALVAVVGAESNGTPICLAGPAAFTPPTCNGNEGSPCGNATPDADGG